MEEPELEHLTTEGNNPHAEDLDCLSTGELVQLMNREDQVVAEAVGTQADAIARAIDAVADRMGRGGRLVYMGAGTSGRLGVLDAVECRPTFSAADGQVVGLIAGGREALTLSVEGAEDYPEAGADELRGIDLQPDDSVVGITASGGAPYVLGGIEYARSVGALTVALSCNRDSAVSNLAEIAITPVVGPEVLSGPTRLKAGTATKLVLNMLSTGVFVRLGKTYGNLMVDLRATNDKLTRRSQRIVSLATGLTAEEARRHLDRCNGEVKTCIVVAKRNVDPDAARKLLRETSGRLRLALE